MKPTQAHQRKPRLTFGDKNKPVMVLVFSSHKGYLTVVPLCYLMLLRETSSFFTARVLSHIHRCHSLADPEMYISLDFFLSTLIFCVNSIFMGRLGPSSWHTGLRVISRDTKPLQPPNSSSTPNTILPVWMADYGFRILHLHLQVLQSLQPR